MGCAADRRQLGTGEIPVPHGFFLRPVVEQVYDVAVLEKLKEAPDELGSAEPGALCDPESRDLRHLPATEQALARDEAMLVGQARDCS